MFMSKLCSVAFVASLANLASFATAQEAPCDASTQACLNVMQANTCFAAYIRGNNVTEMLRCVNVNDQTLAREEVSIRLDHSKISFTDSKELCACYGCTETSIQNFVVSSNICQ